MDCDSQCQDLRSQVYTLHIQETSEELSSPQLLLLGETESIDNRTSIIQNPLLEIKCDIVKIEDSQDIKNGKVEFFEKTNCRTLKIEETKDTYSARPESSLEDIASNDLNDNTSGNGTSDDKLKERTLDIAKSYLDLKEAALTIHGFDLSLPIECDICNIDFDDFSKFDAHMRDHEETKCYMCQLCSKTYMSWQNLVAHRKVCHKGQFICCNRCSHRKIHYDLGPISYPIGDFPVGCEECKEGFKTHNELKRHYREHQTEENTMELEENEGRETEERSEVGNESDDGNQEESFEVFFKCNTCTEEISKETYATHKKLHPNICIFYKCPYCDRSFYTYSRFICHKDAHGIKNYKCKKCPRVFKNKLYWDVHKLSHFISKKYKCFNCQLEFDAARNLSNHIKEVHIPHPERKLTCDICTLHYSVEGFMKHYLHCLTQLKSQQVSIKKEGNYTCSSCKELFSSPKALFRHKKVHSFAKDPYLCEVCGMSIQNLGPFIAHIRSHGKEYNRTSVELNGTLQKEANDPKERTVKVKSFICEFCGNSFKNNRLLKLHVQRHTGCKPFDCTLCSMAFYTGEQLSVHMRYHTGERPYQCSVCKKSFASSGVLYAHRRLHYSTKQHICPVCDKRFLWRSAYHNHMRSHSTSRPFKCNECSKTFLFRHKLTAHKKVHITGRLNTVNYHCTDCGQSFASANDLQNHHENKCYLSMITFMPPNGTINKEESQILFNANGDSAAFSEGPKLPL